MTGIGDSLEQSGTTVTNTLSPRFPRTRLADALAEDYPVQQVVVAVDSVPVHPADIRRLRRRQVVLEAQKNPVPFLRRNSLFYH